MDVIKSIEHEQLKNRIPKLNIGDTIRVHVRVKEGNRERIQVFEGIIIKKQGGGLNETFTVRRISYGVGVEKTFLIHSPLVEKVEVTRVGKVRRAKLFYLRDRVGKAAKPKEKIGARIVTEEIIVKEDKAEIKEEVKDVAVLDDETPEVTTEVQDVKVEEPTKAPEEAPVVETTETVKEEVVDTVKEETVEVVKEEPAKEEDKKDEE